MEDHYRHGWGPAATAVASLEGVEGRLALHEAQSIDGRLSPYERGHGRMSPYDARDGRLSPYDSGSGRTSPFEGGSGRGMSPYGTREGSLSPYEGTSGRGSPYERGSASASPYEARGHGSYQDRARGSPHSGLSPQMLLRPPAMPRACYSGEQALCASMAQASLVGHSDPAVGYANGHSGPVMGAARGYQEGQAPDIFVNLSRDGPGGGCEEEGEEGREGDEEHYTAQVWDALDSLEQIESTIHAGPRWKLETFLEALSILGEAQAVLEAEECAKGMLKAEALLRVGLAQLVEEFQDALRKSSKPLSAEMVREVAQSARAGQLVDAPSPAGSGVPPRCGVAASSMSSSPCSSPSSTPPCMSRSGSLSTPTQAALQDWLPASAVPFLHHMAAALGGGAQGPQAVAAYARVRSEALRRTTSELRIKKVTRKSLQELAWPDLERVMKQWMQDMRAVVLVLLGGERTLCDEIWDGVEGEREACFLALVRESGLKELLEVLLKNARNIALGRNCPERLFALLDMFTTVRELKPHVEGVCGLQGFSALLEEMEGLPRELASAVRDTLAEFEALLEEPPVVQQASEKKKGLLRLGSLKGDNAATTDLPEDVLPASGGVHPVTSYVVNYISNFLDRQSSRSYPATLEYLLLEYAPSAKTSGASKDHSLKGQQSGVDKRSLSATAPKKDGASQRSGMPPAAASASSGGASTKARPAGYRGAGSKGSLAEVTASLLTSLVHNWEARARASPDAALGALFLLNNAAYVHKNMLDPKSQMLSDIPKWRDGKIVDSLASKFQDAALAKVTASLEGGDIKSQLKRFNVAFEELAIRQAGWGILDEDARKKARTGLAARIKEAYAQALLPHREVLCDFKAYRYTPNAVERVVLDYFFLGTPTPAPGL